MNIFANWDINDQRFRLGPQASITPLRQGLTTDPQSGFWSTSSNVRSSGTRAEPFKIALHRPVRPAETEAWTMTELCKVEAELEG